MAKKEKRRMFTVNAWVQVLVGISIEASSMEEAAKKAKELDTDSFVTVNGEYNDGRAPRIAWIADEEVEPDYD